MCSYSMIADHFHDKWKPQPWYPNVAPAISPAAPMKSFEFNPQPISRQEFDDLKRDITEMKSLLRRAIQYDIDNGEAHCESAEKVAVLRSAAALVGETIEDVLPPA